MTTQEKIEAIRQECIRVNPEIVELKFGCELVKNKKLYFLFEKSTISRLNTTVWTLYQFQDRKNEVVVGDEIDRFKIIGRPITLPDVLLAIYRNDEERSDSKSLNGLLTVEINGDFFLMEQNLSKKVSHWNLLKPLEEQEEATISFIHDLLK